MAYTAGQLQALQDALATGTLRVSYEGRSVEYRSIEELQRAISTVASEINKTAGTRIRQYRLSGSKGF